MDLPPPAASRQLSDTSQSHSREEDAIAIRHPTPDPNPKEKAALSTRARKTNTRKKSVFTDSCATSSLSSTSSVFSVSSPSNRGLRVARNRRNPRVFAGPGRIWENNVESIAFPLGMSIAAVLAEILERKDAAQTGISVDHLSMIFSFAIRESLSSDSGTKLKLFVSNLEKSFQSTLRTLLGITEISMAHGEEMKSQSSPDFQEYSSSSSIENYPTIGDLGGNACLEFPNMELSLQHRINGERAGTVSRFVSKSVLHSFERSVTEQARSNDLKTFELGLKVQEMRMKGEEMALVSDSNILKRDKLFVDKSKASFKTEKFMNQLEEARNAELLRKCVDCLVASLLVMSTSLAYGAYVHSYKRIVEATTSCSTYKDAKSWWIPKQVASFNSGFHVLRCQVQVVSRMLFGVLMILAVAYLLLQRSSALKQSMPITFILLLLGIVCGFAGKLCVDTLGGDGYHWLVYWEILCLVHFFSNVRTSALFFILHGPVALSAAKKSCWVFPYWVRRVIYYSTMLLFLPIFCGFMPFAGPLEWKDHFLLLTADFLPNLGLRTEK